MILVTGATGNLGKATIQFLVKKIPAAGIAALARDAQKASDLTAQGVSVRTGDYSDYASMVQAFQGISTLALISSSDMQDRATHHINAINAAQEAGVRHIVYTGLDIEDMQHSAIEFLASSHDATINHLKKSGLTYTILNNTLYADVLPMFLGEQVLSTGVFYPAGEGRAPYATRVDMAEAIANVLTSEGHENKEYPITAPVTYSLGEVAEMLTEITGQKVAYLNPPKDVYIHQLTTAGVPDMYVSFFAAFAEAIKNNEFNRPNSTLEQLLGRKPTSLKEYLQSIYSSN